MKAISLASLLLVGYLSSVSLAAPPPETLTLPDLANHPERLPASVVLQRDYRFGNGTVAHKGDKAVVVDFDGSKVSLDAPGDILFRIAPDQCGLLDAANQAWSALTPAQRAVDSDSLITDSSLWPDEITCTTSITADFGTLQPGTKVVLLSVSKDGVLIAWPNSPNRLMLDPHTTDVIDGARQRALIDLDKRSSRIAAALQPLLVDSDGKPFKDDHLSDKKIFALYYGASWCGPCRAFSPDFIKYLNDTLPKHPELAVVLMSNDKDPAQMLGYMKEEKMPFPAVPLADLNKSTILLSYAGTFIPQLVIVDRFGKQLANNDDPQGNHFDPKDTVAELTKILAAAPAQ